MKLRKFNIRTRLLSGFGLVLLMIALMAAVNLSSLSKIQSNFDENVKVTDVKIDNLNRMRQAIMLEIVASRNITLLTTPADLEAENGKLKAVQAEYLQLFDALSRSVTPGEKAVLDKVTGARNAAAKVQEKVTILSQAFETEEAIRLTMKEVQPLQSAAIAAIEELVRLIGKNADTANVIADGINAFVRNVTVIITGIALVLGCVIAWFVAKSITEPISNAVAIARRVADGDLTADIKVDSDDETGRLMAALRDMNQSLLDTVTKVHIGTQTIATASQQIAAGNMDLSTRTEQQASSLEETASSMEELTSTVKQNADNALQANQMATAASDVAVKGGEVVAEVVARMGSINASASRIVDITSVIDGIAFQTNILALNAAVEAARAGEHGRGFAVVAAEVRSLAQRCATASKEIKTLIDASANEVDAGSRLVEQAGTTMGEVVTSVRQLSGIIAEIANASHEQSAGIQQVNEAIEQMDQVTQQNAALVEESAAAAEAMREQAAALQQTVSIFKTRARPDAVAPVVRLKEKSRPPRDTRERLTVVQTAHKRISNGPVSNNDGSWETF